MVRQAWFSKNAVISLEKLGAGITSSITGKVTSFGEGGGEKATDYIAVFGGGQIAKENRTAPFTVDLEAIPTDVTLFEPFMGAAVTESSTSVVKSTEIDFLNYRITITWADGFAAATGTTIPKVPNSGEALRFTYVDAKAATVEPDEDAEGELTVKMSFNIAPTDSLGNAMVYKEYTLNAATIPLLTPYGRVATRCAYAAYA
jgi:hypothetical protein